MQHRDGALHPLIGKNGLVGGQGDVERAELLIQLQHLPVGVLGNLLSRAAPGRRCNSCRRNRNCGRHWWQRLHAWQHRVQHLGHFHFVHGTVQVQPKHDTVAPLPGQAHIDGGRILIHQSPVKRAAGLQIGAKGLIAVIVAIQLSLEHPILIGRVPLHAAKRRHRPMEHAIGVDGAALPHVRSTPALVTIAQKPKRRRDIATPAHIAPAQASAGIPITPALVGHQILAREQAGATNVTHTQRQLRHVAIFLQQAQFQIQRLVLVGLAARNVGAIELVLNVRVAKPKLQPIQWLQHAGSLGIGPAGRNPQAHGTGRLHARSRCLQQPHLTPVAGGQRQVAGRR